MREQNSQRDTTLGASGTQGITPRPIDWLLAVLVVAVFLVGLGLLTEYVALETETLAYQAITNRIEEARP
ncbi:MAG: hypothetical protein Q8O33_12930 [Pseudomonadota bacterium]|nr:hypothetical protein [Pseudomonadota bacterium]